MPASFLTTDSARRTAADLQEMASYEYFYARRALNEAGDSVELREHVKLDQKQAANIAAKARAILLCD